MTSPNFLFAPVGLFFKPKYRALKYIVLVLISLLLYFFSSLRREDQSTAFCMAIFRLERNPVGHASCLSIAGFFFDGRTLGGTSLIEGFPKVQNK